MKVHKQWLRRTLGVIFTALLLTSLNADFKGFKVVSTGKNYTEIEFNIPEYEQYSCEHKGINYTRFYDPMQGLIMEEGLPEVLSYSFLLSIPFTGTVDNDEPLIIDKDIFEEIQVFPSQGFDLEIDEKRGFLKDESFYSQDTSYPYQFVQISRPAIMRNMRLVSVTINPMSYNPAREELTIIKKLTLRLNYNISVQGENELLNPHRKRSRAFDEIQRGSIVNFDQFLNPATRNSFQPRSMIVVHRGTTNAQYIQALNNIMNWKRDKGFEVTPINTTNYPTNVTIKNYIKNAYDNWEVPPEYVIFVGDYSSTFSVPMWVDSQPDAYVAGNAITDHPYSMLAGDDVLADVLVGRISISSALQLTAFWHKVNNYEKTPFMENTDWFNHNVLVCDRTALGASAFSCTRYINEIIKQYDENYNNTEILSSPFPAAIQDGLNAGASFCGIRCWHSIGGWRPGEAQYTNGLKLPHLIVLTCYSMDFTTAGGLDLGNQFRIGTPITAKGPITVIGSSHVTDTAFNNILTAGYFAGFFTQDLWTNGQAVVYSKLEHYRAYWNSHPWRARHYFHMVNIKGDPSLDVWKGTPRPLFVEHPETLPPGSNSISIKVKDIDDEPITDAWVTIRKGDTLIDEEVFATGYTDETGEVILYFNPTAQDEVRVTVTKVGHKPYLGNFELTGQPAVTYHSLVANDDFAAGEIVNFILTVRNHRNQAVNGLNGVISTNSEYIEIVENSSAFGNVAANNNTQSNSSFTINISPDTPSGYNAQFELTLTDNAQNSWISRFNVVVNNAKMEMVGLIIEDDGNGVLDPLENARLNIRIKNVGDDAISNLRGTLTGGGYGLDFVNDVAFYGNIEVGQTVSSQDEHFAVATSSLVMPGMSYQLQLTLHNEDGFNQTIPVELPIGSITVNDPLGPCNYGYWIFDSGDENYMEAPEYDWIEICPDLGGQGTNTNLTADFHNVQNSYTMDLPFTFRFYGIDYDVITICANGWITFYETELSNQGNYHMPGALGPDPMVAAFWDNLGLSQGGVFTWYDEEECYFVIQWHRAQNVQLNAEETFQIILYDPEYHFTSTLDGPIKIQYKVFNNVNNRGGTPGGPQSQYGEWGNYCTIGISDHTGLVGLEYTFNNRYPTAARPLGNETAIYITTGSLGFTPYVAIEEVNWADDNDNNPQFGETGDLDVRLRNLGGQDAFDVVAVLSTTDEYITVLEAEAQYGDMVSGQSINQNGAFTIRVADDIPDNYSVLFNMSITAGGNLNWNFRFYQDFYAPKLSITTPLVYDPAPGGNNNGLIDPGEELIIYLPAKNFGGADTPPVNLTVTANDPLIEILEISELTFPSIGSGTVMYPAASVRISPNAVAGHGFVLNYLFETGEYQFDGSVLLGVGGIVPTQLGAGELVTEISAASPISIYFRSLHGQAVYTAEEFAANGVSSGGLITHLGFWVASAPAYPLQNFVIRMAHTLASDASKHIVGPYIDVFSSANHRPTPEGWHMLELDPPFEWNGVDNLLVDTAFSPVQGWSNTGTVRYYEVENGYRYARADSPDQTNVPTDTTSPYKPQIKLMVDTSAGDTSNRPENLKLTTVDSSTIMLDWVAPLDQEGFLGFNVYRNGSTINEEVIEINEFIDTDLDTLTVSYYYVTALYETRETLPSNIVGIRYEKPATPKFTPEAGVYHKPFNVTLTSETENAKIYYTTDGTDPTEDSILYEEPFYINYHTLVKTRAIKQGQFPGEINTAQYYVLYTPTNLSSSGSLASLTLRWDKPWSPSGDNRDDENKTRRSSSSRNALSESNTRQSRNRNSALRDSESNNEQRTELLGYNVYRSKEGGRFVHLNDKPIKGITYLDVDLEEMNYRYYVTAVYEVGESKESNTILVGPLSTDDEEIMPEPIATELLPAYPNPFNPETTIQFTLSNTDQVKIEIFDISGSKVTVLTDETYQAGRHSVIWNGADTKGRKMGSGIYFYRMTSSNYKNTKRVLMLK